MILNNLFKKSILAVLIACSGVVWLNEWHQYGYTSGAIDFPPVSNWWRDTAIIFIPVMLAVWVANAFAQWFIDRSNGRMSPSTRVLIVAAFLAVMTSLSIILMENNRTIWTGIGNELAFLAGICGALYPDGNLLLGVLQWFFPSYQAMRFHILLQDGFNLMLVNLTITIFLILIMEGIVNTLRSAEQIG